MYIFIFFFQFTSFTFMSHFFPMKRGNESEEKGNCIEPEKHIFSCPSL